MNRVFVQVHNRGQTALPGPQVRVLLLLADASGTLPALPADCAARIWAGDSDPAWLGPDWRFADPISPYRLLPGRLDVRTPQVVAYDVDFSALQLPGTSKFVCAAAFITTTTTLDRFTSTLTDLDVLTMQDKHVAYRKLYLVPQMASHHSAVVAAAKEDLGEKSKKVDLLFAPWSAARRTPGAAVRVIRHGRVIHAREYGLADIDKNVPITPKTAFLLASVTKPFTALAVMMLVEKGELSYDTYLSELFPEFPAYARRMSIRHLLHHTSGLGDYRKPLIDAGLVDPKDSFPRSVKTAPSRIEPTSKQVLRALARQPDLLFPPGDEFLYSNAGYLVLGQIIERYGPHSYPAFLKKNIFRPAKMKRSSVPVERWRVVPRRAVSYRQVDGGYVDIDYTPLNMLYGEDGIYTTIDDMVRWDQVLYTGKLIKQSSLEEAFRTGVLNDGWPTRYGYGWGLERDYVFHSGDWLGFNTSIFRFRRDRFTVIVLANCEQLDAESMAMEIARILRDG
jgi:CubicO group peptidase (beta-lactamase class C family)